MSVFGEIQQFKSRSGSDDEDEEIVLTDEEKNKIRTIHWLESSNQFPKWEIDELIVADGMIPSVFVFTYLLNHHAHEWKILGFSGTKSELKILEANQSQEINQKFVPTYRSNFIYYLKHSNGKRVMVCQLYNQLKNTEIFDWIHQLNSKVEFKSSLVICTHNKANYFSSEQETFPCVKFLSTHLDNLSCTSNIRLEAPNFLTGTPAAITQFCISKKLPSLAMVCVTSSLVVDLQSVKALYLAAHSNLKDFRLFVDNDVSKKLLLAVERISSTSNALYI